MNTYANLRLAPPRVSVAPLAIRTKETTDHLDEPVKGRYEK